MADYGGPRRTAAACGGETVRLRWIQGRGTPPPYSKGILRVAGDAETPSPPQRGAPAVVRELGLRNVFVAGPFRNLIDPATGLVPPRQQERFEALIAYFESGGCTVFNAHKREKWGAAFLAAGEFTRLDFAEVSRSDVLVAIPGPPASPGTHIELGWASALGKPIVLLLERDTDYAPMLHGLRGLSPTAIVETTGGELPRAALEDALRAVCAGGAEASRE